MSRLALVILLFELLPAGHVKAGDIGSVTELVEQQGEPWVYTVTEKDPRTGQTLEVTTTTWARPRAVQEAVAASSDVPREKGPLVRFLSVNDNPEGDIPHDLAFSPDGNTLVVVNRDTDNMTFFDVNSRSITQTLEVGDYPVSVAVTPNGRYALSADLLEDAVSVVDLDWRRLVAQIPITGEQPFRVVASSDSRFAVVGVINDGVSSSFSIIDLVSFDESLSFESAPQGVIARWAGGPGFTSGEVYSQFALSPDDAIIVLPDRGNGRVMLYDPGTGSELASLVTTDLPTAVDISSDGALALVTHESSGRRIAVIDLATRTLQRMIPVQQNLANESIQITHDNRFAVASALNKVLFVDLVTGDTTSELSVGVLGDIEISFDHNYAFVSGYYPLVIDIASQSVVATLPNAVSRESITSPTELRAAAINNYGGEDLHFFNIDGEAAYLEGSVPSGVLPEGDAPLRVAVTPDCSTAVSANATSSNAAVIDLHSGSISSYVDTGEGPHAVAVTPDGAFALIGNRFEGTASIVDLEAGLNLTNLAVPNMPIAVLISPDGRKAFVASVSGTSHLYFIELNGASSRVTGSLDIGQPGGFGSTSGIALSPDGSLLAVCESFSNTVRFIDTAAQATVSQVGVGSFPTSVAFSPDGSRAYVTNSSSDDVWFVDVGRGYVEAVVGGISYPVNVDVDATDTFLYVTGYGSPQFHVVDTQTASTISAISLPGFPRAVSYSTDASILLVATSDPNIFMPSNPELVQIKTAGANSVVAGRTTLTTRPTDLTFCEIDWTAVTAQPGPDGIDIVRFSIFRDGFESGDTSAWSPKIGTESVTTN